MIPVSQLVTPAAVPLLTTSEAKDYLRVDESAEDARIDLMIAAATARLEEYLDRKFINQTWRIFFDDFPFTMGRDEWWDGVRDGAISQLRKPGEWLLLPFGPISTMTSLKTYDDEDTAFTMPSSDYTVDKISPRPRIGLKTGAVWPSTVLRSVNGVEVEAVFGYGAAASNVPQAIRLAALQLVAAMYEHRGDEQPKIPAQALMLLEPYRLVKCGRIS